MNIDEQVEITTKVVIWYLERYRASDEMGLPAMFCNPDQVGEFAVDKGALSSGEPDALMRVLVATTMFQRRQDQQILRILRGMPKERVDELSSTTSLLAASVETQCPHLRSLESILNDCDLSKDPATKQGCCTAAPEIDCPLKAHTVWLKRYGHFGKVPMSIALALKELGVEDLAQLYALACERTESRLQAALWIQAALSTSWRINDKIAAMFLSALSNPDLWHDLPAPWSDGLDWTQYVVIDSNVDLFLRSIAYKGSMSSYAARRDFIFSLAEKIDLAALSPNLNGYNPRLVQQAMYLFMSGTNRRVFTVDCAQEAPHSCASCDDRLRVRCPFAKD